MATTYNPWPNSRFTIPGNNGISSLFQYENDEPITISKSQQSIIDSTAAQAITNPDRFFDPANEQGGIKGNATPTPNVSGGDTKQVTGLPCVPGGENIQSFLNKCLSEAVNGTWRETGQGGRPSNPNITGIWPYIGICATPPTGGWASDQTAWCMGFVQFVLKSCGYKYFSTASAASIADPRSGCTLVTSNINEVPTKGQPGDVFLYGRSGGSGHVCFLYQMESAQAGFVSWSQVGGNQTPKGEHSNNDGDVTKSRPGLNYAAANFKGLYRPSCS